MADSLITAKVSMQLDGASKVKAQMIAEAKAGADEAGVTASASFGDSYSRGLDGRLRDSRGRFVNEGKLAGSGFSKAFNDAAGKADGGNVGGKASQSLKSVKKDAAEADAALGAVAKTLIGLAPAAVPLAGGGVAAMAAFGTAATAAGIGVAGLGIVGKVAFKDISDASKNAAKEGSAAFAGLNKSEQELYASMAGFKGVGKQFTDDLDPTVLPIFANGINLASKTLPRFEGTIRSAASGADTFVTDLSAAAKGPVFSTFLTNLEKNAGPSVAAFGGALLDAGEAGTIALNDLAPLTPKVDALVASLGQKAVSGARSQGFTRFLSTIESDAPLAGQAIGAITTDVAGLISAVAPLGQPILQGITGAAKDVQPLIPALSSLSSELAQDAAEIGPVVQGYLQFGVALGGGMIGLLTKLASVLGDNSTELQILASAVGAIKLGSMAKDALAGSKAVQALSRGVKTLAAEETALAAVQTETTLAGTATAAAGAATAVESGAKSSGKFTTALKAGVSGLGKFNVVGLATTAIIGGAAAGFASAAKENAAWDATNEAQLKSATKNLNLLNPAAAQTALSISTLQKNGQYWLAAQDKLGFNNKAVQQLDALRQQATDAGGVLVTLGQRYGVSAKQAGDLAQQAGYTGEDIANIGALYDKYQGTKSFLPWDKSGAAQDASSYNKAIKDLYGSVKASQAAIAGASDPTYNLAAAMKDLDSKLPHDNIKDVNTILENYSTIAAGTVGSSAAAGDALAQLKGTFDKNTSAAGKNAAAQAVLSGNLLQVGPQTRSLGEQLVALNGQYTQNLEATFAAAGGAKNLAVAGAKVVTTANQQKHALYDTLLQMGLSAGAASSLAEKYGSIPTDIKTKIQTDGTAQVKKDLASVNSILKTTKPTSIHVTADIAAAQKNLNQVFRVAQTLPKSQRIKVTADAQQAQEKINQARNSAAALAKEKFNAKLTADNQDALNKSKAASDSAKRYATTTYEAHLSASNDAANRAAADAKKNANAFATKYSADLDAKNSDAANKIQQARAKANEYAQKYNALLDAVDNASGTIGSVRSALSSINGYTATTYIRTVKTEELQTIRQSNGAFTPRAGGGPVKRGVPYLVGEVGREIFVPEQNGRITPNARTEQQLAERPAVAAPAVGIAHGQMVTFNLQLGTQNMRVLAQAVTQGQSENAFRGVRR